MVWYRIVGSLKSKLNRTFELRLSTIDLKLFVQHLLVKLQRLPGQYIDIKTLFYLFIAS